jgi:ABC-type multidrug transport system ATPase subunit
LDSWDLNGAGKTTAIRGSVNDPAANEGAHVERHTLHAAAEIRRQIGVLPGKRRVSLHLSGEEFLHYHARLFGHTARLPAKLPHPVVRVWDSRSAPIAH